MHESEVDTYPRWPRQGQVIGWWSAGVTSAVAIKMALDSGLRVVPIYFDTGSSHPDNARFLADCERWYGTQIITFKHPRYTDVMDVVRKERYLNGPSGAKCTGVLKKEVRQAIERWMPYDAQIFGFEFEKKEMARAVRFVEQYPTAKATFPLIDRQLTKANCLYLLESAGIAKPAMYTQGYHNNNCIGCVKGGMGYWNKIRVDYPAVFDEMAKAERDIGHSCIKGVYLDTLESDRGHYPTEITPECGVFCPVEEP